MRRWIGSAWIQIMTCGLFGTKSSSWVVVSWTLSKLQWNFSQNIKLFINDNAYKLLNLIDLKDSMLNKTASFNVWVRYFAWNLKGALWNSTQNILPIDWKVNISFTGENLRAFRLIRIFEACTPWITIVYISAPLSFFTDILCDSLYIMVQYNMLLHTAQQLRM